MKTVIRKELVKKLDEMILAHGSKDPELLKNLQECKDAINDAEKQIDVSSKLKALGFTLSAAKFLKDLWEFIDRD